MTDRNVKLLLALAILIVTLLPLSAAFYFLDRALQTSLDLGFNTQIVAALDTGADNLRALRDLDPANRDTYRQQFESIQTLRHIYSNPQLVKGSVLDSLKIYFAAGLAAAVALALSVAALLSRRIAQSYSATFNELIAQRERLRYLEEMASWQGLAKMLAHEIRNPLTPIELLVTSLQKAHRAKAPEEFAKLLGETEKMIGEELRHLQSTVSRFSEFAKLPSVQLNPANLCEVLEQQLRSVFAGYENARYELEASACDPATRVMIDATMLRQVLANLVRNGVEANPGKPVRFSITLASTGAGVEVAVANGGTPVPQELVTKMFDPYVSAHQGKDNMGLGLAIVKKIVVEHGGSIAYEERGGRPVFLFTLLRAP